MAAEFRLWDVSNGEQVAGQQYSTETENGRRVARDMVHAAKVHRQAAERGNTVSMVNLANMYLAGRGVPQSDAEAFRWYREAAERGDRGGQRMMGVMYSAGLGVPKDDDAAARWFRRAAGEKV